MSKFAPITAAAAAPHDENDGFARLHAVDSVIGLLSDMAGLDQPPALAAAQDQKMIQAYQLSAPMVQRRFDEHCDELAGIAKAGAKALLHLHSLGRKNTAAATRRLMREIDIKAQQALFLLKN